MRFLPSSRRNLKTPLTGKYHQTLKFQHDVPLNALNGFWIIQCHFEATSIIPISRRHSNNNDGKIKRIPNTAIKIPTVKKSFFQNDPNYNNTEAFTTALSKDSETSITAKIAVMVNALSIVATPASGPCV